MNLRFFYFSLFLYYSLFKRAYIDSFSSQLIWSSRCCICLCHSSLVVMWRIIVREIPGSNLTVEVDGTSRSRYWRKARWEKFGLAHKGCPGSEEVEGKISGGNWLVHVLLENDCWNAVCILVWCWVEVEVAWGLTSHQTHYRSYRGRIFVGKMTQLIVSKQWTKIGSWGLVFSPTRSTPPCYNNTTCMQYEKKNKIRKRKHKWIYAQWNGPSVTKPKSIKLCWFCLDTLWFVIIRYLHSTTYSI